MRYGREEGFVDHGLVDEYRQRKPSYYVWKELNAPAVVGVQWNNDNNEDVPASFTVTVKPNSANSLPSYPLHDYRLSWEIDDDSKVLSHGEHRFTDLSKIESVSGQVEGGADAHKLHMLHLPR